MNGHPDTAAGAAYDAYRERIAAAQRATLVNQAQRLQPSNRPRTNLVARTLGLLALTLSHRGATAHDWTPESAIGQTTLSGSDA